MPIEVYVPSKSIAVLLLLTTITWFPSRSREKMGPSLTKRDLSISSRCFDKNDRRRTILLCPCTELFEGEMGWELEKIAQ